MGCTSFAALYILSLGELLAYVNNYSIFPFANRHFERFTSLKFVFFDGSKSVVLGFLGGVYL